MIASRHLVASLGVASAALIAMAWLVGARAGAGGYDGLDVALGKALFERLWVAAPSSTAAADGLGPLFNGRSCASCHMGGGPARFVQREEGLQAHGLVVRVAGADGSPHPELGTQIQDRAVAGLAGEGRVTVALRNGALQVGTELMYPSAAAALFETRIAPSLKGRAVLDDIDEQAVLALADPADRDGDGISGRAHMLRDDRGKRVLGRYGAKATGASLMQQTADAAAVDIGLSSPLLPRPAGDCTALQPACTGRPNGRSAIFDGEEVSAEVLRLITAYVESLAPRQVDAASDGLRLFAAAGCAACHVPALPARDGTPRQAFTDLLLHDLGPEGTSHIRAGDAEAAEWRTAPLAGLDPLKGARRYLHDGRAASLRDAIAQHGGEASRARAAFFQADGRDQQMILDFLAKL